MLKEKFLLKVAEQEQYRLNLCCYIPDLPFSADCIHVIVKVDMDHWSEWSINISY